jgi:hypothetical protein
VSRLHDMNLYNARGNEFGDVGRVVQGQDGKQYLTVGASGFLGIGERTVAIPTERGALQGDRLIIQGVVEDQIRSMPAFDENNRSFRRLDDNRQVQINPMR